MTTGLTFFPLLKNPLNTERIYLNDQFIGEVGPWLSDNKTFGGVRAWWRLHLPGPCETRALRFATSVEKAKIALARHVEEWQVGRGSHGG